MKVVIIGGGGREHALSSAISLSPILNDGELYSPIYFQRINEVDGGPNGKELLREIIEDIEITAKEPNVSKAR